MEIVVQQEGTPYEIALEGRLDTQTSPQLDEFATKLYKRGINDIIIDMSECEYVSSAGLRVLVSLQKRATSGGSLALRNVQPDVMDVLEMTSLDQVLTLI